MEIYQPGQIIHRPSSPNGVQGTVEEAGPTIVAPPFRECYACRANPPDAFREAKRCQSQEEAIRECLAWIQQDSDNEFLCVYWEEAPEEGWADLMTYQHPCAQVPLSERQARHRMIANSAWS